MKHLALPVAIAIAIALGAFVAFGSRFRSNEFNPPNEFPILEAGDLTPASEPEPELATFGAGCFWCTEAVFRHVHGVKSAVSGYSGGHITDPTYEQVCMGTSGHAEVVQIEFDSTVVSYAELLEVFWRSHDPTTVDRQGDDEGSQYRSVIFYHSDHQRKLSERYKGQIDAASVYSDPLVTQIVPFTVFYPAGDDHQDYFARNPRQPYCSAVIGRKLDKLKAVFGGRLLTGRD